MRGFTVACACLVILPLVLAYPWGEGKSIFSYLFTLLRPLDNKKWPK